MKTVIFIHGTYGNGKENWFPWLKKNLEKLGYKVIVPRFPTPKGQRLNNWLKIFKKFEKHLSGDTIIVAHSIGSSFTLRMLEITNKKIRAAYLIAPYVFVDKKADLDVVVDSFIGDYDWRTIKKKCREFFVFGSDNDTYVPIGWVKKLSTSLGGKLFILKKAGHVNEDAGYLKFPLLLEKIKKIE